MKMKKIKYLIVMLFAITYSCQDYLDVIPDNLATVDDVFANRAAAEGQLYTCYSYLPVPGQDVTAESGDELARPQVFDNTPGVRIAKGFQNTNNPYFNFWNGNNGGTRMYEGIRNCNLFISRIGEVQDIQEFERENWIAEAKFLKAYYHFYLCRMYGPIIINDENIPVSAATDAIAPERSTVEEVFTYVLDLMDEAIPNLPVSLEATKFGKITKAIGASVKARVAVTYASPLFNGNPIYTDFVNSEGTPFFPPTYDESKWADAVTACEDALEACDQIGLSLYLPSEYVSPKPQSDITLLKAGLRGRVTEPWNTELIWGSAEAAQSNAVQSQSMPKLFPHLRNPVQSNRGLTMRIAEQFYTKNGVPIDEDPTWDFNNRFKLRAATIDDQYFVQPGQETANLHYDREPRFYADIAFDRGTWYGNGREETDDAWYVNGRFNEYGSRSEAALWSRTGYFPKKFVHIKSKVNSDGSSFAPIRYPFPYMRLADLYLLYAEALNESNSSPTSQVYEYVDKIRSRAGLDGVVSSWANYSIRPDKPATKEGMREIIQQERLIELTGEGPRFWDLRRWLLAKEFLNKPIRGWNVSTQVAGPETYYQVKVLNNDKFGNFEEKDYLWPLATSEIINTPTLNQNPGW